MLMSEDKKTNECIELKQLHEKDYINECKTIGDEIRIYLNLEEHNIKDSFSKKDNTVLLPYIVTIDNLSKEVLSIKRDWTEDDKSQTRKKDFIQYYGFRVDVNE
jgi:hypothetical protein